MGLAASQARLLFITNRQNDVSAKLQRLSNTNMILARDEEDVSTKYNRMLSEKTMKLKDGADLSYDGLMGVNAAAANVINLITNKDGQVVLSSTLAKTLGLSGNVDKSGADAALEAAGITSADDIKTKMASAVAEAKNNPTTTTSSSLSEVMNEFVGQYGSYPSQNKAFENYNDLVKAMGSFSFASNIKDLGWNGTQNDAYFNEAKRAGDDRRGNTSIKSLATMNISDLLKGTDTTVIIGDDGNKKGEPKEQAKSNVSFLTNNILSAVAKALGFEGNNDTLKDYIQENLLNKINANIDKGDYEHPRDDSSDKYLQKGRDKCLGGNLISGCYDGDGTHQDAFVLNVSELLREVLSLVSMYYTGESNSNSEDFGNLRGKATQLSNSKMISFKTNEKGYSEADYLNKLKVYATRTGVNYSDLLSALKKSAATSNKKDSTSGYYETLYNALKNGWVVDDFKDGDLQAKLENGTYKLNYKDLKNNTDLYTEENKYSDKEAEAYYNQEMAKIHRKEKQMDIEQQKLQTEYTSLTNDLNSVKQILEANVQRSFTYCQQG